MNVALTVTLLQQRDYEKSESSNTIGDNNGVSHKHHENVSSALSSLRSDHASQLHQSALWAVHRGTIQRLVEHASNTLASAPDRGDGAIMQGDEGVSQWLCSEYF